MFRIVRSFLPQKRSFWPHLHSSVFRYRNRNLQHRNNTLITLNKHTKEPNNFGTGPRSTLFNRWDEARLCPSAVEESRLGFLCFDKVTALTSGGKWWRSAQNAKRVMVASLSAQVVLLTCAQALMQVHGEKKLVKIENLLYNILK